MISRTDIAVHAILLQVQGGSDLGEALAAYTNPFDREPLLPEEADDVLARVSREIRFQGARATAEVEDPIVIAERHLPWYEDWLLENPNPANRYYWNRLAEFVGRTFQSRYSPEEAGAILRSIDNSSDAILHQMESTERGYFSSKGLVVGYVQSGKTANFTAVVAKALDAGYRLVVVLTGIHENLRRQTQQRMDCELTGEPDHRELDHVPLHSPNRRFSRFTTRDCDFASTGLGHLDVDEGYPNPILLVMKKNPARMRSFIRWVERASEETRFHLPLLLIDDEADLASIDTRYGRGQGPTTTPTPTNESIRRILALFPRNVYVGYTATPFANVLIDMSVEHDTCGRDLYPRNFIVALPRPEDYFGAERVFSRGRDSHYVRTIATAELPRFVPTTTTLHSIPRDVTGSLYNAVLSFILAGAARAARQQGAKPMTMLVHTTHRQAGHSRMREVLDRYCNSLRALWADQYEGPRLRRHFACLWHQDFMRTTQMLDDDFPGRRMGFSAIEGHIPTFLDQIHVLELNASSEDELDYTQYPDRKVIAVGGNQLSRGLTLEGLAVSFYLRRTGAYDTLLQMGRWFGYRSGYEDLTRVYTSEVLASWFEDLALVEQELRDDIGRYEDEGLTPAEVSVRIRAHRTLRVTARNKMGAAQVIRGSFSGRLAQTIWFQLDQPAVLRQNLATAGSFVDELHQAYPCQQRDGAYILQGIPHGPVMDFLEGYRFDPRTHDAGPGLDSDDMLEYIRRQIGSGELTQWNVAVVGQTESRPRENTPIELGGVSIIPVRRTRMQKHRWKIGVLSDPNDLTLDEEGVRGNPHEGRRHPLLLLYPVWHGSQPDRPSGTRETLFKDIEEQVDLLGLVIVFPKSQSEPNIVISQPDGRDAV